MSTNTSVRFNGVTSFSAVPSSGDIQNAGKVYLTKDRRLFWFDSVGNRTEITGKAGMASSGFKSGTVLEVAKGTEIPGFIEPDGRILSGLDYPELFTVLGQKFGGSQNLDFVKQFPDGPAARYSGTLVRVDNIVYMSMGYNGAYLNDFWAFDMSTGIWSQKASCPYYSASAIAVYNKGTNSIFMFIPITYSGTTGTYGEKVVEYDISTNTWITLNNFGTTAHGAIRVQKDEFLYVIGGIPSASTTNDMVQVYDMNKRTMDNTKTKSSIFGYCYYSMSGFAAPWNKDILCMMGGYTRSGSTNTRFDSFRYYNMATNSLVSDSVTDEHLTNIKTYMDSKYAVGTYFFYPKTVGKYVIINQVNHATLNTNVNWLNNVEIYDYTTKQFLPTTFNRQWRFAACQTCPSTYDLDREEFYTFGGSNFAATLTYYNDLFRFDLKNINKTPVTDLVLQKQVDATYVKEFFHPIKIGSKVAWFLPYNATNNLIVDNVAYTIDIPILNTVKGNHGTWWVDDAGKTCMVFMGGQITTLSALAANATANNLLYIEIEESDIPSNPGNITANVVVKNILLKTGATAYGTSQHNIVYIKSTDKLYMEGVAGVTTILNVPMSVIRSTASGSAVDVKTYVGVNLGVSRAYRQGVEYNGRVYYVGGYTAGAIQELISIDPLDINVSTSKKTHTPPPMKVHAYSAFIYKDQLVVFGGSDGSSWENIIMIYNFTTDTWKTYRSLISDGGFSKIMLDGDTLYLGPITYGAGTNTTDGSASGVSFFKIDLKKFFDSNSFMLPDLRKYQTSETQMLIKL